MGLVSSFLNAMPTVLARLVQAVGSGSPEVALYLAVVGKLRPLQAAALPRVVIVGAGGAGKSTLLKQMLAHAASQGSVPVWVSLAALPADGPLTIATLLDHLVAQARARLGVDDIERGFFEALVADGQLAIGFDALDECGSLARRQKVRALIVDVAREWKRCRVFVTSRPDALRETPLPLAVAKVPKDENEFVAFEPMPFQREDVAPFLRATFDDGEALAGELLRRTGIEALTETPLTLTLVGLVARTSKGLPATRTPLFARCLDTVCETWDDAKDAPVASDGLDAAERLDVLRRLGWAAQCAGGDELGARAARSALAAMPALASPARAKAVVDGLARRNLLLRAHTAGDGSLEVQALRFAHPQFREYLAGAHLAEQFALDAAAVTMMDGHWFDSGWVEVLHFAVASLDPEPQVREALLRAALAAADPWGDLLRRPTFLVARLLARVRSDEPTLVDTVVAKLEAIAAGEPALGGAAAEALLALARHAAAQPALERFARGAGVGTGVAGGIADDPGASDILRLYALRWRMRAIDALAVRTGHAAALALLPSPPYPGLAATLEICELRSRLGDRVAAHAAWRQLLDDGEALRTVAASMDKAGEGAEFDGWLRARLDGDELTIDEAQFARERNLLADDAPTWARLFDRARAELAALEPTQPFAPQSVSAAVYAALETGLGARSDAGRALVAAALRHPALVWFAAPHVGKAMPDLADEAARQLSAYVLAAQGAAPAVHADRSRLAIAVQTLCDDTDDAHYPGADKLGHGSSYKYSHDEPFGVAEQQYAPDVVADAAYYQPTSLGAEATVKERWERIRRLIRGESSGR